MITVLRVSSLSTVTMFDRQLGLTADLFSCLDVFFLQMCTLFIALLCSLSGENYCDELICLSVCPLMYIKTKRPNFTKFSVYVNCGVTRSSSDNNAIRYVLPVLWMTSRLPIRRHQGGEMWHLRLPRFTYLFDTVIRIYTLAVGAVAGEARNAVTRVVGDRVDTERLCRTVAVVHVTLVQVYNTPTTTSLNSTVSAVRLWRQQTTESRRYHAGAL